MIRGIFRFMQADHIFESLETGGTAMKGGFLDCPLLFRCSVRWPRHFSLRRYMLALLRERNTVIKRVAESSEWEQYLPGTAQRSRGAAL